MATHSTAIWLLTQEARALLTRLERAKPFVLLTPMVMAATISPAAQTAIERHLAHGRRALRGLVDAYLQWLYDADVRSLSPMEAQRRFIILRLRFNAMLTQFDIFADVLNQRSEHETGVWLSGLDAVAADALSLPGNYYATPPVICYLDRGHGAAIRRARTRLPGGGENPVAVVRVPRERMIGSGVASSLVHEVGHQGAALLDLVNSLRPILQGLQKTPGRERLGWQLWERWISEILADFWSVAKVGVASTLGLIGVVSLPRAFVFRISLDDPHPFPWIRVKLSCALGRALYPHPQWRELASLWESFYPPAGLDEERRELVAMLEDTLPGFVTLLVNHRPQSLRGASLLDVMAAPNRQPARLADQYRAWRSAPMRTRVTSPTLACAVIGQARMDGQVSPEEESHMLGNLLTYWALHGALNTSARCAAPVTARRTALTT